MPTTTGVRGGGRRTAPAGAAPHLPRAAAGHRRVRLAPLTGRRPRPRERSRWDTMSPSTGRDTMPPSTRRGDGSRPGAGAWSPWPESNRRRPLTRRVLYHQSFTGAPTRIGSGGADGGARTRTPGVEGRCPAVGRHPREGHEAPVATPGVEPGPTVLHAVALPLRQVARQGEGQDSPGGMPTCRGGSAGRAGRLREPAHAPARIAGRPEQVTAGARARPLEHRGRHRARGHHLPLRDPVAEPRSGWAGSNRRPPAPEAGALTKLSHTPWPHHHGGAPRSPEWTRTTNGHRLTAGRSAELSYGGPNRPRGAAW